MRAKIHERRKTAARKPSGERSKEAWSGLTSASPFQRVSNFQTLLSPQVGHPQLTASSTEGVGEPPTPTHALGRHDVFLSDDRVLPLLPKLIGTRRW